jgi:hypothetical protein
MYQRAVSRAGLTDEPEHQGCEYGTCDPVDDSRSSSGPQPQKPATAPIVRRNPHSIMGLHSCVPRPLPTSKTVRSSPPLRHVEKRKQAPRPRENTQRFEAQVA